MPTGDAKYDLAIIGAGINGAGIARDAALRGLKVVVFDKNDMCSGCSAISSRLIHGGLRYLEYGEIPLVYESLHERRYLRLTAPHLVKPLRICIPIFVGAKRGPLLIRLGMIAYDLLSLRKSVPNHEMLSGSEIRAAEPGLRSDGLRAAARYYDAQVTFAERLVLENLLAARAAGADVRTHCEVTGVETRQGAVSALRYRESGQGEEQTVTVDAVVNAAGPWVDKVLATSPLPSRRLIGGTKGSHIVVGPFDGAPGDAFYVEAAVDGRPFFIMRQKSTTCSTRRTACSPRRGCGAKISTTRMRVCGHCRTATRGRSPRSRGGTSSRCTVMPPGDWCRSSAAS
jgi:glycerol-3-phosphate dehydrogenase